MERQREWSRRTFGPGTRTTSLTLHIEQELDEIRAAPNDVMEWVDVVILALDGAWRAGYTPEEVVRAMELKQEANLAREWKPSGPDEPNEHIED